MKTVPKIKVFSFSILISRVAKHEKLAFPQKYPTHFHVFNFFQFSKLFIYKEQACVRVRNAQKG